MRYKYVATLFTYGNELVTDDVLDNHVGNIYTTNFYGRLCVVKTFKHERDGITHFMAEWETKQSLSEDKHYVDVEFECHFDEMTQKVVEIVDMKALRLSPVHANIDAIKVSRLTNFNM